MNEKMDYSILSKYRTQLLGISIILIMVFHFFEDYNKLDINGIVFNISKVYNYIIGSIGVEFFLFLSGMGLYYSLVKKYDVFYFYKKRLIRVLIPYMMYGFTFWFIKDIVIEKKTIGYFLYDYSLLSFWVEGNRNIWYITYILALYFITPFLYRFLYKNEKKEK